MLRDIGDSFALVEDGLTVLQRADILLGSSQRHDVPLSLPMWLYRASSAFPMREAAARPQSRGRPRRDTSHEEQSQYEDTTWRSLCADALVLDPSRGPPPDSGNLPPQPGPSAASPSGDRLYSRGTTAQAG
jgi:hypothetical protein